MENNPNASLRVDPINVLCSGMTIPAHALAYMQGGRIWFATTIRFNVFDSLITTTEIRSKKSAISEEVVNRFLDRKHKDEIKLYIKDNKDSFTIPPLTLVSDKALDFRPLIFGLEQEINSVEEFEKKIKEKGSLLGFLLLQLGDKFSTLDGNHRAKAIMEIGKENQDVAKDNYILVNIVYETSKTRIRQDFVDINKNARTTSPSINTLFDTRDPLSKIVSDIVEDENSYLFQLIERLATSISKNSLNLYTLNNIKNAVVELSGYNSQSSASINKLSKDIKLDHELYDLIGQKADTFFDLLSQNKTIAEYIKEPNKRFKLRSESLITSGVGLIILCRVVSTALKYCPKGLAIETIKKAINMNWDRSNEIFIGRIISADTGAIISNVTAIKDTANYIFKTEYPDLYQIMLNNVNK